MKEVQSFGPSFEVASDYAVIVLGNSERKRVGQLWGEALDSRGIFKDIEIVTTNEAAGFVG